MVFITKAIQAFQIRVICRKSNVRFPIHPAVRNFSTEAATSDKPKPPVEASSPIKTPNVTSNPTIPPVPVTSDFPELIFSVAKPLKDADKGPEVIEVAEGNVLLDSILLYDLVAELGMADLQKKLAHNETERALLPKLSMLVNLPRDKFNALIPDTIQRNRLKIFLRDVTKSPLASDDSPILIPTVSSTQISKEALKAAISTAKHAWIEHVKLPEVFKTTETGTVEQWFVKPLVEFRSDTTLCEVETSVATFSIDAPDDGYISEILLPVDTEASVNHPIAVLVHLNRRITSKE